MSNAVITQSDYDAINGSDMMEYLKAIAPGHHRDLLEWPIALYFRGIITRDELTDTFGDITDEQVREEIGELKRAVCRWLVATPFVEAE